MFDHPSIKFAITFGLVVLLLQAVISFGHYVLYRAILSIFFITDPAAIFYLKMLFIPASLCFIFSSILALKYYNRLVKFIYAVSVVWMGILFYVVAGAFAYWILFIVSANYFPLSDISGVGKALLLLGLTIALYGISNAREIYITKLKVKFANIPGAWEGKRAVWISDLHLGHIYGNGFVRHITERVLSLKPDIIFIGGDVFDGTAMPTDRPVEPLSKLIAPLGTYYITGNHDEFFNPQPNIDAIKKAGIKVLNNEEIEIDGIQIVGVDYLSTAKKENFESVLNAIDLNPKLPSILLRHEPSFVDIAEKKGFKLMLSGHTHQAQVFPLIFFPKYIYKGFEFGLKKKGQMQIYTSSGVGTWGPPLRVGSYSQIVSIDFERL
jgi:hypothetical protein